MQTYQIKTLEKTRIGFLLFEKLVKDLKKGLWHRLENPGPLFFPFKSLKFAIALQVT